MKCYDCETELQKGWHYCPNCKRKLRKVKSSVEENYVSCEEEGKCHNCSYELESNWNFCPNCGTGVEFYSTKPSVEVPTMVMEDKGIAPELMPVEEENKMFIESVKEEGIEEGSKQKCLDIVRKMLKREFDFKTISEITGLPVEHFKKSHKCNYLKLCIWFTLQGFKFF